MKKEAGLIILIVLSFLYVMQAQQVEMVGELNKEDILKNMADWQAEAVTYSPKPEIIEKLRAISQEVRVEIFLGTWCPDSKAHVSAYFKIMELVDNPLIQTTYIGLPRIKDARSPFIPAGKNIEKIPTFIVIIQNQEKGRIIETPTKSVEEDLLAIINK